MHTTAPRVLHIKLRMLSNATRSYAWNRQ